jgi:hypothetical protein
MPPTRLSYPNSTGPKQANNPVPAFLSLRSSVAAAMVRVHRITPELADEHVSQMDLPELRFRVRCYALLRLGLPLALARPESAESRTKLGETEGQRTCPLNAIAVRSPSGGGGGGVAVCRVAELPSGERGF